MEGLLRSVVTDLAERHHVKVLAQRTDDGPWTPLHDSVETAPQFEPFLDGGARVEQLRFSPALRAALAPMRAAALPGLTRYAYSRPRRALAMYLAAVAGPTLRRQIGAADVVHMWGPDLLAYAAVHAAKRTRAVVAISPFAHRGQWGTDPASAGAYRSADLVFPLLATEAELYCELGAATSTIRVCGACSPGVPVADPLALRARHGIGGPLVLFLGARRAYKGVDVLLDAVPLVAEERPDVTFAFVGPGPALRDVGSGARVLDIGKVGDAERASWLAAADLLCLPSQGEILPISILEAWSAGTPVLTSDLDTLRELVDGSGGGMTAARNPRDVAAAVVTMVGDPGRLREMGRRGHARWSSSYTVPAVTSCFEQAYASARKEQERAT